MSENKKDGQGVTPEVEKELEEIAALLQKELDKQKAQQDDGDLPEAVTDWENLVDNGEKRAEVVGKTEKAEKEKEVKDGEPTEDDGKAEKIAVEKLDEIDDMGEKPPVKFSPLGLICLLAVVVLSIFGVSSFETEDITLISGIFDAQSSLSDKKISTALDFYYDKAADGKSDYLISKAARICYENGYISDTQNLLANKNFNENAPWNILSKKLKNEVDNMMDTIQSLNSIVQSVATLEASEIDYDGTIAKIDEATTENSDKCVTEYYKFYVALLADKDAQTQFDFLEAAKKANPTAKWLWGPDMANCYRLLGQMDKGVEILDGLIADNVEDTSYYSLKTKLYRMDKQYDAAVQICNAALEASYDEEEDAVSDPEIYRQLAVIYLLKGDYKTAASRAETATQMALNLDICNTAAICCIANGDEDGYNEMVETLAQYSATLSNDVIAYKEGTKTLEQIYLEGTGECV